MNEERAVPCQIVMDLMDNKFCVIINFAVWFEIVLTHTQLMQ